MRIEEILKAMANSFFLIVTGTVCSMFAFCMILHPNAVFTLADIGRILLMGIAGDLPYLLFLSGRELNRKQMFVRTLLHVFVLLTVLLYLAVQWDWVNLQNTEEVVVFVLTVLLVYTAVFFVTKYRDRKLTDKLNERLKERYRP